MVQDSILSLLRSNGVSSMSQSSRIPYPDAPGNARLRWVPHCIIAAGILLRLVLFFQSRDLIGDEANIARNLQERGYAALLRPLDYQQFAPPGFLWAEKLATQLAGFGEMSLRLLPLLCGVAALFAFHRLLRRLLPLRSYWYPLAVLSLGFIYVEYSTVVKPYMSDVLITLLLVDRSLSLQRGSAGRKALWWQAAGGCIALWCSMPALFVLGGIGIVQVVKAMRRRDRALLAGTCVSGLCWLLSFSLYYLLLLRHQIGNEVLQAFHEQYFLFLAPHNAGEWRHNLDRMMAVAGVTAGYTGIAMACTLFFFFAGMVRLLHRDRALLALLLLPVLFMFLAAALHYFTLIERVILFALPLLLCVMGFGLEAVLSLLRPVWLRSVPLLAAGVAVLTWGMFGIFVRPYAFAGVTSGLEYAKHHTPRGRLYLYHAAGDAWIYYTTVHPGHDQWQALLSRTVILKWDDDYTHPTCQGRTHAVPLHRERSPGTECPPRTMDAALAIAAHLRKKRLPGRRMAGERMKDHVSQDGSATPNCLR